MKILSLSILILVISTASCSSNKKLAAIKKQNEITLTERNSTIISQRQLLKDWALCQCILYGYKDTKIQSTEFSPSLYHDQSLYGLPAEVAVDSAAKAYSNSITPSTYEDYKGKKAILYFCTEFYKSKTLDSLIKSYDGLIMK